MASSGCRYFASALLLLGLLAPEAARAAAENAPLSGTRWQLVQIESRDEATGTPEDRRDYTVSFEPGGELLVTVDCNRGRGTWTHDAAGGLRFDALALTEALCPPGSLHDRVVEGLRRVRSFAVREGRLLLATEDGDALLEFEPVAARREPSFDCARAKGAAQELVCDDAELAALDVELDARYRRALERAPDEELEALRATQRGWIKGRDECSKSSDLRACVKRAYERRIAEL